MSRWKASFIHLLISAVVVGSAASLIIYFWYPPALMHMAKADRLLMLIGGIDLIVGPLLTLIVYKAGKKYLKLDLAIIGLLQLSFLAYGLFTTWSSRPVFLVAVPDRFELVFANEISAEKLSQAKFEKFKTLGITRPILVGTQMPGNLKEAQAIMFSAVSGHGDIQTMPRYFVEYSQVSKALAARSKSLDAGKSLSKSDAEMLQVAARSYGYQPKELRYLTLASSRGYAVMLINADTAELVGPVNADP